MAMEGFSTTVKPRVLSTGKEDSLKSGRLLRELSESVLKTLTQLDQNQGVDKDSQYRNLLASRCRELKGYLDNHPLDNLAVSSPGRPDWLTADPYTDLTDQRVQSWLTTSLCPLQATDDQPTVAQQRASAGKVTERSSSVPSSSSSSLRYKTEMCRSVSEGGGVCRYGDKCQYAHSRDELRPVPRHPRYKTQMCREYHLTSICSYGVRCNFLHDEHKQAERVTSASDDRNEVFSLPGSWSGRSTPELELLMSRWMGSSDAATREGSTGTDGPLSSSSSSESVSSSPFLIPVFSPYLAVIDNRFPGGAGGYTPRQQLIERNSLVAVQKQAGSENVFQFPACIPLTSQLNGITYAYRPLC